MKNKLIKKSLILGILMFYGLMQGQSVTGKVSDGNGPLPGASVVVKGTTTGTQTDFDGNFSLQNIGNNAVLSISFMGYVSQEITVGNQSRINVTLEEDSQALGEVVVVAYGTSTRKDLTGAVSTISSEELNSSANPDLSQALQGKAAGVNATSSSGAPGASASIVIRGVGSFRNTSPLYVIDGFPTQDISFLNPQSIKSITVLKDASATALYGVRASNGVVIINTKDGVKGKVQVSINSYAGVNLAPKNINMLNAQQFATFASDLGESQEKAVLEEWDNPSALRDVNWQDYAFRNAFKTGHNLSIQGGGEDMKAAFTAGIIDEEGAVIGSSFKRYNLGANLSYDISDNLRVRGGIKYAYSERYTRLGQGYYNLLKVITNVPYLSNATGTNIPFDGNGNYGAFTPSALLETSNNVLAGALRRDQRNGTNKVLGNFSVDYDVFDGLTATANFNFISQNYAGSNFNPTYEYTILDLNEINSYNVNQNTSTEYNLEAILDYKKTFGVHTIGLTAGASTQKYESEFVNVGGTEFLNNDVRDIQQAKNITNYGGSFNSSTIVSQFGRLNYNYDSKYYLTATIRRDGNGDRFGSNNLYGIFPAFGASWNIDQESFMDNSGFTELKLRGSWGETGSYFGIPAFNFLSFYNNGSVTDDAGYNLGPNSTPVQGLQPINLANPDLKWETQRQWNIGLDGEFLDRSVYFSFDYFNKTSADFLFQQTIPAQTGFSERSVNGGNIENKGLELMAGYRKVEGDFTFDISANFSKINNEIKELVGTNQFVIFESNFAPGFVDNWSGVTRSYLGGNVGTFYGYRSDGIFQSQSEIDDLNTNAPDGVYQKSDTAPGDRRFKDLDGDGKVTGEDREVIGSPIPDFYGGVNFTANYKNWELGINIYGSYGNDILNFTQVEQQSAGAYGFSNAYTNISTDYFNNRWTPTNPSNTYARAVVDDKNQNSRVSDHFVEDGSFLRLKNVKLGYNLPDQVISNLNMSSLQIYVSAQNLVTLTSFSGWDPEIGRNSGFDGQGGVQTSGIDFAAYPTTASFNMGINLQF